MHERNWMASGSGWPMAMMAACIIKLRAHKQERVQLVHS